jgi:hypothetical protein
MNPQFFAAYNTAIAAGHTQAQNPSQSQVSLDQASSHDSRVLNPLAPPFVLFHPLQLLHPPSTFSLINRQSTGDSPGQPSLPLLHQWYPHPHQPSNHSTTDLTPFPAVPAPPVDFASPVPLGQMLAVPSSLLGFPSTENGAARATQQGGICWDPVVGMYRSTNAAGAGAYEQQQQGAANAA